MDSITHKTKALQFASVSDDDDQDDIGTVTTRPASGSIGVSITVSSAEKTKLVKAELLKSIPADILKDAKDFIVSQAAITHPERSASVVSDASKDDDAKSVVAVKKDKIKSKLKRMGTSKVKRFKSTTTFDEGLEWVAEYGRADSSIIFKNQCAMYFKEGLYQDFDDMRDSDDEEEE